ncbi:UvrD-helicase domain-containing protein [Paraburkholderia phytofirmans]|uniref:DNA 3'-5' helicase n=1 Tax=Paraburkholderia phytofirmans (strain DSM 17436 / LMG 22146 / PsJN) TaxID=398527 RepID=B2T8W6_PARPJ|nr:UvrD-helicase domain-containing protein [Paraburkholderia phytofirmans]ACD20779.1 UvrD/REP helicase [Paraburkholderia phytofirmans PsJN]
MNNNDEAVVSGWIDRWLSALSCMTVSRHERLLEKAGTRHGNELTERLRLAKSDSYALGKTAGDEEGFKRGRIEGHAAGKKAGLVEGRVLERQEQEALMRARAEAEARRMRQEAEARAKMLVSEKPIGINASLAQEIRRDVLARTDQRPRDAQWEMILSDHPATYVVAGAGSGKSTSLVLRVIALNLYRGINRNEISVFTFTKESRKDFVKKLRTQMQAWGETLSLDDARGVVRTFHSMVLRMARSTIDPCLKVLELIDLEKGGQIPDTDIENLLEAGASIASDADDHVSDTENPKAAAGDEVASEARGVARERDRLLRLAYERAFSTDPTFAQDIATLHRISTYQLKRPKEDVTAKAIAWVAKHDAVLNSTVDRAWRERIACGLWPAIHVEPVAKPVKLSSSMTKPFHVHGYLPSMKAYLVLGGAQFFSDSQNSAFSVPALVNTKRKLLAARSEEPIIWIDTVEDLQRLASVLQWQKDFQEKRVSVPMFEWIAPSDLKRKPVFETFYELAQFVENLGLPVAKTLSEAVDGSDEAGLTGAERVFARAVSSFWPVFEELLAEEEIWTFNELFAHFSEDYPANFKDVPPYILDGMRHLLIDEFQDISPQIVKWIRGCQRELVKRGRAGSLTCVGDDWQSIYGWRGSSPDFFVRFKHFFPASSHGYVKLEENFRSSDHILRCAESVLVDVPGMGWKTCVAQSKWAKESMPVLIHETPDKLPYDEIERLLESEVMRTKATARDPLLVLARRAKAYKPLVALKRKPWGKALKFLTFHGAKGLESRSVVLLGDCAYNGVNPLRNFLYRKAGLGSFDEAQHAEARRLAYVGVTRAMERCYWYAKKESGGALASIPMARSFAVRCDAEGNVLRPQLQLQES